jgi:hypothetical protein
MDTTPATITAVFAKAATARWTRTNLGDRTEIKHDGYTWTIERPTSGGPAYIIGRYGWGGTEHLHIPQHDPAPAVEPAPLLAAERAAAKLTRLIG